MTGWRPLAKRVFIRTLIGIAFVGGLFAAAQPVAAISVSCSTAALSTAITTANNTAGTDTLDLTANCTYSFTAAGSTDSTNGDSALPKITSTIIINGNGATIKRNATASFRLFYVSNGASLTLKTRPSRAARFSSPGPASTTAPVAWR